MAIVSLFIRINLSKKLNGFSFFDLGNNEKKYFDDTENILITKDYVEKTLNPALTYLESVLGKVKVNLSIGGVALDMFKAHEPKFFDRLKKVVKNKNVELVSEPHFNSVSYMFSEEEFKHQISLHKNAFEDSFGKSPKIFKNTNFAYSEIIDNNTFDFDGIIVSDNVDSNKVYRSKSGKTVIVRSSEMVNVSQDINAISFNIDYLTTDDYKEALEKNIGKHEFLFGSELAKQSKEEYVPSRASKFTGNMQKSALNEFVKLEHKVKSHRDKIHVENWRHLSNFEHFESMSDENVSSVPSAYEAFINYVTVLKDLDSKLS